MSLSDSETRADDGVVCVCGCIISSIMVSSHIPEKHHINCLWNEPAKGCCPRVTIRRKHDNYANNHHYEVDVHGIVSS